MSRSRRAKEAIKTGLAMAIVYWIGMRMGWMNPYWAAFAVAFVSLPTQGQSLNKGVERLTGTLVGCLMALFFLGLFPQERWLFAAVISLYCGVVTYPMTGRKLNYFWFCAGFVCLIVVLAGTESSADAFQAAVARTVETAMGVVVWTLVSVFLWPQTNVGTLDTVSMTLARTQAQLFRGLRDRMLGAGAGDDLAKLARDQVAQRGRLDGTLRAAGAESYAVHEVRHLWSQFEGLTGELMTAMARWQESLKEIEHLDVPAILPAVRSGFEELTGRLEQVGSMLAGAAPKRAPVAIDLDVSAEAVASLSHFDRAAIVVTRDGLLRIDAVTRSLFECVRDLKGFGTATTGPAGEGGRAGGARRSRLPVPDPDRLRACFMPAVAVWVGFLLWVFVNPPGHASLLLLPTIPLFAVAQVPTMKLMPVIRALAAGLPFGMLVYVFIMPRLSSYVELGPLIFTFTFVACYFFPGMGRVAGLLALINMVPIQNQQTYDFAVLANSYIFVLLGFGLALPLSHITFTPRPEKAFLRLVGRFFRSCEFVMSRMPVENHGPDTPLERWRRQFHRQELLGLPRKLATWGGAIDHRLFPANSPAQVRSLVTQLSALAYRLRELVEAGAAPQADLLVRELRDDVRAWRLAIQQEFSRAAEVSEVARERSLSAMLTDGLAALERRTRAVIDGATEGELTSEDYQRFYRLLGGYRGVSEATLAYAGVAGQVNWRQWRESRF